MSKTNRRDFLIHTAPLIAAPLLPPILSRYVVASSRHDSLNPASSFSPAAEETQSAWRYCEKCHAMFFNGYREKGRCPAGEGHQAEGYGFHLPYGDNLTELPNAQINWRYCDKCHAIFFDGYSNKGRCAAGGGHNAQGYRFRLPHDIGGDRNNQDAWRYCQNCHVMFFDGYPNKGNCAAGGGHVAQGYMFVLPHGPTPDIRLRADVRTDDMPIGGWVEILATQDGDYRFSGHMHNSGALNIKYTLGVVLIAPNVDPSNFAFRSDFGFAVQDHQVDGTQTIINRKRDDDWQKEGNDPRIAQHWEGVLRGQLYWRLVAADSIAQTGIGNFLNEIRAVAVTVISIL